jgi:hypothetical protein
MGELDDIDIPETDEMLDGGAPRVALKLGGLEVEVEGSEDDSLSEVKDTYDDVLEDALGRGEKMSDALRERLVGYL